MRPHPLAELYLWLSAALDTPAAPLLRPAFAGLGRGCIAALNAGPLPELDAFQRECDADPDGQSRLMAVRREHARLFLGPPRALVRPYESCYFGEDRLLSERALAVVSLYARAGLAFDARGCGEAPDHLVVELTFLSRLHDGTTALPADARETLRQAFLRDHLGVWGPLFAARLLEATAMPLYRAAGRMLQAGLALDASGTAVAGASGPLSARPTAP